MKKYETKKKMEMNQNYSITYKVLKIMKIWSRDIKES